MNDPLVSVLTPAYNAADFISEAMGSVLNQSYQQWELVVVNDGSEDHTSEIAREFSDPRIRVIDLPQNIGLAAVRNYCVSEATGEYSAFLDADDRMTVGRLKIQVDFLQAHPEIALTGGQIATFQMGKTPQSVCRLPTSQDEVQAAMLFFDPLATSTVMVRTPVLQSFQFREQFPPLEDYDLWQRLSQQHQCYNLKHVLAEYRVHGTQSTKVISSDKLALLKRIRTERLKFILPGATESDAELHHHLCEGTFWDEHDDLRLVVDYCRQVLSATKQNHLALFADTRDLMRRKLAALSYAPNARMTPHQYGLFSKSMLHPLFRRSSRETLHDIRTYLSSLRTRVRDHHGPAEK